MAGIRSDTRKGRLSLVKERGGWGSTRTFHWLVPLTFILFPYRKARGDKARKVHAIPILCGETKAQYPVVAPHQDPFKLCDFPLVTRETLLYW